MMGSLRWPAPRLPPGDFGIRCVDDGSHVIRVDLPVPFQYLLRRQRTPGRVTLRVSAEGFTLLRWPKRAADQPALVLLAQRHVGQSVLDGPPFRPLCR